MPSVSHSIVARRAFTLLELLVTLAVIGILIGIVVPLLSRAQRLARGVKCQSNLHQIGIASNLYNGDNRDSYWQYYKTVTIDGVPGRNWWFGFEANGPNGGMTNRPLDTAYHILAPYESTTADKFQCPDFPWTHPNYFSKFAVRAATYGYNCKLSGGNSSLSSSAVRPLLRRAYELRGASVVVFVDAVQYEMTPSATAKFNEGHYVSPTGGYWGYAHFRHDQRTLASFVDGHVGSQAAPALPTTVSGGFPVANLASEPGTATNSIYGF